MESSGQVKILDIEAFEPKVRGTVKEVRPPKVSERTVAVAVSIILAIVVGGALGAYFGHLYGSLGGKIGLGLAGGALGGAVAVTLFMRSRSKDYDARQEQYSRSEPAPPQPRRMTKHKGLNGELISFYDAPYFLEEQRKKENAGTGVSAATEFARDVNLSYYSIMTQSGYQKLESVDGKSDGEVYREAWMEATGEEDLSTDLQLILNANLGEVARSAAKQEVDEGWIGLNVSDLPYQFYAASKSKEGISAHGVFRMTFVNPNDMDEQRHFEVQVEVKPYINQTMVYVKETAQAESVLRF